MRDPELIFVVGHPSQESIREAVSRERVELLSFPENRDYVVAALPGWTGVRDVAPARRCSQTPRGFGRLRVVTRGTEKISTIEGLPPELRSELELGAEGAPVVAALEDGCPVAFCYAASRTEGLWDIAIDTLAGHRRRGHAARCVSCMVEHMKPLRPAWGAEEANAVLLGLAARLGFVPVDELIAFHPPRN